MRRKIISQGKVACTISIPIEWVRDNRLKPGDEVNLYAKEQNLIISTDLKTSSKRKDVHVKSTKNIRLIRSIISSCYKAGYDEINIVSEENISNKQINDIVFSFTGLEVVNYGAKSVKIKAFVKTEQSEIINLLIKMHQQVNSISKEILDNWENLDYDTVECMVNINLRKLRDFILRNIHETNFGGDLKFDYHEYAVLLEKIGGELREIAQYIKLHRPRKSKLTTEVLEMLDNIYQAFLKKDFANSSAVMLKILNLTENNIRAKNIMKTLKREDSGLVMHFHTLIWIYRHISSRLIAISSIEVKS